jgi:Ca2+-binding RTX toxin-like protein
LDDPSNHVVPAGGALDGVAMLIITSPLGTFLCSGALLEDGVHVLTAAHCAKDSNGNLITSGTATFHGDSSVEVIAIDAASTAVHPSWTGNPICGYDVAVLKLASMPTADITRYSIDETPGDDVGTVTNKVGYGKFGQLAATTAPDGNMRDGTNKYDADQTVLPAFLDAAFDSCPGALPLGEVLNYDFDNGVPANDAFGVVFGIPDSVPSVDEVMAGPGDSGGPSFTTPKITGITSYGLTLGGPFSPDVDGVLNSSPGEFGGDTRVSSFAPWINITVAGLCFNAVPTIIGTGGDDTIQGTSGNDVIVGLAGSDTINGLEGNDLVCGRDGDDSIFGGAGDDRLSGGKGNDKLRGEGGIDIVYGDAGADQLFGGPSGDKLYGGAGGDTLFGGGGADLLSGGAGVDTLDGGLGTDNCLQGETLLNCP